MRLFGIQLRSERVGLIGWGVGLFLLALAVGASYAAVAEDAQAWEDALGSLGGIEDAFGVDSLTSPDGYFKSNSVALYPLLLGIYGGLAATKAYAGAQEAGRLDHILARPVTRMRYLFTSAGALWVVQLLIVLAAAIGGMLGYVLADQPAKAVGGVFAMSMEVLPIALAHLSLGVLAGTLFATRGPAVGMVMGVVVGGFAIDLVGKLVSDLSWLEWATPYGYWGHSDWYNGDIDPGYLVVCILLSVGATAGAAWRFHTKDL